MTTDLIAMAKQAGMEYKRLPDAYCEAMGLPIGTVGTIEVRFDELQAFADLIRKDEREACAVECDKRVFALDGALIPFTREAGASQCAKAIRARTMT